MKIFLNKVKISFINSSKGLEDFSIVSWGWGGFFYFFSFFILDKIPRSSNLKFLNNSIAIIVIIYFIWHMYATIKCFPKAPKLTKEEKEQLKIKNGGVTKVFFRKLFLQESITKTNPRSILIVMDLFFILHFYSFI